MTQSIHAAYMQRCLQNVKMVGLGRVERPSSGYQPDALPLSYKPMEDPVGNDPTTS